MSILLFATLDTKGPEAEFVRDRLRTCGVDVRLVDTGCLGEPSVAADILREEFFRFGPEPLDELRQSGDRGRAIAAAAVASQSIAQKELAAGRLTGVLGLGGSAGTTIATAAMRALPLGLPKVMVSTLASGQTRSFLGDKDIFLLNPVVDIAGLNRISREVLAAAAEAMAGLVHFRQAVPRPSAAEDRPLIAATMFGVTTPCVQMAREQLEQAGYEVLVFHATGAGGQALESLVRDGQIAGVLDITTTELADELVGGILTAGPDRLTAAGAMGIPQVISVGALDMVNFGPFETVPERFANRKFHRHNANVTLMRTTPDECRELGREIGRKASAATGPVRILFPLQGVSAIDRAGQPFDDPAARIALLDGLKEFRGGDQLLVLDCHINDPEFATTAVEMLKSLLGP
jgi:uncharacterized protein (UPF0261 family)